MANLAQSSYRELGLSIPVQEVLDPALWRSRYAAGLQLGGVKQAPLADRVAAARAGEQLEVLVDGLPDDTIRWHLRAALSELEVKLGVPLGIEVAKATPVDEGLRRGIDYDREVPRLPYTRGEAQAWYRISLPPGILSIERIRAFYYNRPVWDLSGEVLSQVLVEHPKEGEIHIIPTALQMFLSSPGNINYGSLHVVQMLGAQQAPLPGFWAVDYTRGHVAMDGRIGQIEAVLGNWVYATAGILLLSMGGLAQSKGISSTSVSMDGVSRSVSLQASAIYGLNSALEHAYEEATKRINLDKMRAAMRGLRMYPFSH